jgi:hypothetical protein
MVRGKILPAFVLSLLILFGANPASADPITFTGWTDHDFGLNPAPPAGSGTFVIPGLPQNMVSQPEWMTQQGWVTGWNIQQVAVHYDQASDTLYVGIQMYNHTPAGNVDGNGTPGNPDPRLTAAGGQDPAHVGGLGSITMGIDTKNTGSVNVLAGIPEFKYPSSVATGTDGFAVALRNSSASPFGGVEAQYGTVLTKNMGNLAFDPSSTHPDFEFTIKNFSTLPGLNLANGFGLEFYAGSPNDVIEGKDFLAETHVPSLEGQTIPEPATLLAWSIVAGAGAWKLRRNRRNSSV